MDLSEDEIARKQRRNAIVKASKERARQAVANGTYTGSHGIYCYQLGCRCPDALAAAKRKEQSRRTTQPRVPAQKPARVPKATPLAVEVLHYPPRGYGFWKCPDCHEVFLHRPPLEQASA